MRPWLAVWAAAVWWGRPAETRPRNDSSPDTVRLVRHLLDPERYDRDVRPVRSPARSVRVTIRMNLYQILEVNEPNQNIVLYVWVTQVWEDEFLGWDPRRFGGIDSVVLPYHRVWLPDTYLYNSLEMTRENVERWISVILTTRPSPDSLLPSLNRTERAPGRTLGRTKESSGAKDRNAKPHSSAEDNEKTWRKARPPLRVADEAHVAEIHFRYPAIYTFSCRMYIRFFPFDVQNCTMTFGSWTYDSTGIDFYAKNERVLNESYIQNEEWSVLSFDTQRQVVQYACCPHPFVLLKMDLVIQRKPLYYIVNLVVPTSIITAVAVVGFFMPASSSGERAEKVNLGITTLLAMSILLLMVTDQMPTTSDFVPLIGWFFLTIIVLISLGTAITSFIILLQQQAHYGRRLPGWLRSLLFSCLAPALFLTIPDSVRRDGKGEAAEKDKDPPVGNGPAIRRSSSPRSAEDVMELEPLVARTLVTPDGRGAKVLQGSRSRPRDASRTSFADLSPPSSPPARPRPAVLSTSGQTLALDSTLRSILGQLSGLRAELEGEAAEARAAMEWELLAAALDRLFLLLFMAAILVVTLAFLFIGLFTEQTAYVRDRDNIV